MVQFGKMIAPTFGGINLEDIKAPECFYIERELQKLCDIPVFHDDQHGTAIISGAALINALEVVDKKIDEIKMVINGAGASRLRGRNFTWPWACPPQNIIMCDSRGVIYTGREAGMNEFKAEWTNDTEARTLEDALVDADVFIGLSRRGGDVAGDGGGDGARPNHLCHGQSDPEITYEDAQAVRGDIIFGTGRSDYPNQVNNVLGFPLFSAGRWTCARARSTWR